MKRLWILLSLLVWSTCLAGEASPVGQFHLKYTSRGSMYPVSILFTIDNSGRCAYLSKNRRSGATVQFTTRLSPGALQTLRRKLLDELRFFSLPPYRLQQPAVKDAGTSHLVISLSGRQRRIGGYAVSHHKTYQPVFSYIQTLIRTLRMQHGRSR